MNCKTYVFTVIQDIKQLRHIIKSQCNFVIFLFANNFCLEHSAVPQMLYKVQLYHWTKIAPSKPVLSFLNLPYCLISCILDVPITETSMNLQHVEIIAQNWSQPTAIIMM